MKKITVQSPQKNSGFVFHGNCPHCGKAATFDIISDISDLHISPNNLIGHRKCPDRQCGGYIFCALLDGKEMVTFPPQRIDFNKSNIPPKIINHFEEAITAHAESCFTASAMMIRRTVEEICHDKGTKGGDLKERIKTLRDKIVLPESLFIGMDNLRLLGNDAAHIEAKDYDNVGKEETEVGIQLTKEILKAIYQYDNLVSRLEALKAKTG